MAEQFRLIKFERGSGFKKYNAIIEDKKTKKRQKIPFGDRRYSQFFDATGLKLYSRLDHGDEQRRKNYLARHEKTRHKKWSPSWLSATYLWSAKP